MKIYKVSKSSQQNPKGFYCAWCKKLIRGEDVGFLSDQSSHGVCEECYPKVIQEIEDVVAVSKTDRVKARIG